MLSLNSFRGDQVWSDMFMEPSSICVGTMRDKVAFNAMNEEVEHCNYYEALGLQEAGEDGSVDLQVQSLDQEHEKPSEQILQHPIIWIDLEMTGKIPIGPLNMMHGMVNRFQVHRIGFVCRFGSRN